MKSVFSNLNEVRQRTCDLVHDKVYVKSSLQYHGGTIFVKVANNPDQLEKSFKFFTLVSSFLTFLNPETLLKFKLLLTRRSN